MALNRGNNKPPIDKLFEGISDGLPDPEHTLVNFRTTKKFKADLLKQAEAEGRTVSGLCKWVLGQYLEKHQ